MKLCASFYSLLFLALNFASGTSVAGGQSGTNSDNELLYNVQLQNCPRSCEFSGPDLANWTSYDDLAELKLCNQTVLFSLNVHNSLSDPTTHVLIKACGTAKGGPRITVGESIAVQLKANAAHPASSQPPSAIMTRESQRLIANLTTDSSCGAFPREVTAVAQMAWSGSPRGDVGSVSSAAVELARYFRDSAGCGSSIMLASAGNAVVGAIAGGSLVKSAAASLIEEAKAQLGFNPTSQLAVELCHGSMPDDSGLDARFGLFADLQGNTSSVQNALRVWANGGHLDLDGLANSTGDGGHRNISTKVAVLTSPFDTPSSSSPSSLGARADCRAIQVVSGDSCGSLATRCGISGNDFMKYNSYNSQLCSTLKVKQWVCCSLGSVPNMRPKPNPDGTCSAYTMQKDDGCWSIADAFGITQADIEQNNKQTWGWTGCNSLMQGQVICLSNGHPPMPATDVTANCGPQVPGTQRPANWADITKLNPCPLNACCNIWGKCGTTSDFCIPSPADTGAPGTARPGTAGCISNCGTDIVNNKQPPWFFFRVGYFEAWNVAERPCLHMDISQFNSSAYSHVHFAFATITPTFKVNVSGVRDQFDKLKAADLKGVKKILSFGGWSFSTSQDSYPIFRSSVTAENRRTFAANVVDFLHQNPEIDGVDFDWEYPGATDLPDVLPGPGVKDEGANYLDFLRTLKSLIPQGKSLSMAIPSSYWYLRGFPVADMSNVVDYFIYMTYDLHGQWDFRNKWSSPGCPQGNCLRSHINLTETINALSMVTKAGVPSYKLMLGLTSYGRSFRMADPKCTGPMCEFTSVPGKPWESNADPGDCTGTAGYIANAEILELQRMAAEMGDDGSIQTWHETPTHSDMMTWDGNWVAYLTPSSKAQRIQFYAALNFGGISDWAVDLEQFHAPPGSPDDGGDDDDPPVMQCSDAFAGLDDVVSKAHTGIPAYCWGQYIMEALPAELDGVLVQYNKVADDYDGKFGYYEQYIKDIISSKLNTWMYPIGPTPPPGNEPTRGRGMPFFDCKFKDYGASTYLYQGPCPVPGMSDATWNFGDWELELHLKDEAGFYKGLQADLGIQREWIRWGKRDIGLKCPGSVNHECSPSFQIFWNFPLKADDSQIKVPNPKELMTRSMANITTLRAMMLMAHMSVATNMYDGDELDAVRALSTPVFMLAQAVDSMAQIKEIGGKIEEEKKKSLILMIVSLCLLIVPMVGEIGFDLAGLANLARFAFIAGEAGNAAMSLVDIIGNPEAAPFAIMGMVMGAAGRGLKVEKALKDAGAARKLMSQSDVDGMGAVFKRKSAMVSTVIDKCIAS